MTYKKPDKEEQTQINVSIIFIILGIIAEAIDLYYLTKAPIGTFNVVDGLLLVIFVAAGSMIIAGIEGLMDYYKRRRSYSFARRRDAKHSEAL